MSAFSSPKDIQVAVVGYGGAFNMGKAHLDQMQAAGMTPRAVVEIDPARLEVATKDFPGIETYAKVEDLLAKSKANLVTIITPHNTHAPLALQCLGAGRHVVCEKPFAITTEECDQMIAEARKQKLMVSTYHNRHWDGWILKALEVVRSGTIGEVVRVESHMGGHGHPGDWWRSNKTISGGIMYDWGVHHLEYILQLIPSEIAEVCGFAKRGYWAPKVKWKEQSNEDEGYLVVRFRNGAWASVLMTSIDATPRRGMLDITGTLGAMTLDWGGYEITIAGGAETVVHKGKHPDSRGDLFYKNIAEHLVSGVPLIITPEWARRPIHILDLANQSALSGRSLPARYP